MKTQTLTALKFLLLFTILTGIIYPLTMTVVAQIFFRSKANGSLIQKDGKIIGSEMIGQRFDSTIYFWSRPSATGYNPIPSGASNYGPVSDTLRKLVAAREDHFALLNSVNDRMTIPEEMIFASGSGLDPHISPKSALMQTERIFKVRNFNSRQKEELLKKIHDLTEAPQFFCLGEPRINVLILNLELDKIQDNMNLHM
jgi:potassium-transporting ATPase KdpC subunit